MEFVSITDAFGTHQVWLQNYWGDNRRTSMPIQLSGGDATFMRIAVWRHEQDGCHVWWEVPQLFDMLGLSLKKGAASWIQSRKHAWSRYLGRMPLMFPHLRPSSPYANVERNLSKQEAANRPLQHTSFSSVSLVVMLWGWGSGNQAHCGFASEDACTMSLMLLDGLAASLPQFDIRVNIDPESERVGRFTVGRNPKFVTMKGGTINRLQLYAIIADAFNAFQVPAEFENTAIWSDAKDELTLSDLCQMFTASADPVKNDWLVKQILWGVGSTLDAQVAKAQEMNVVMPHYSVFEENLFGTTGVLQPPDGVASSRMLLRYMTAAKRQFADADRLSFIMDGSRQDHRKIMLGVVVNSDDVAAWAPPQARVFRDPSA
eukprot:8177403-Pyramimonas_sp.AAC.1